MIRCLFTSAYFTCIDFYLSVWSCMVCIGWPWLGCKACWMHSGLLWAFCSDSSPASGDTTNATKSEAWCGASHLFIPLKINHQKSFGPQRIQPSTQLLSFLAVAFRSWVSPGVRTKQILSKKCAELSPNHCLDWWTCLHGLFWRLSKNPQKSHNYLEGKSSSMQDPKKTGESWLWRTYCD